MIKCKNAQSFKEINYSQFKAISPGSRLASKIKKGMMINLKRK